DAFSRGSIAVTNVGKGVHSVTNAANPFIAVFTNIKNVLVGAWQIISQIGTFLLQTFTPVWQQLSATFTTSLLPSLKQLWAALVPLMPVIKLLAEAIGVILVVALGITIGLLKGII